MDAFSMLDEIRARNHTAIEAFQSPESDVSRAVSKMIQSPVYILLE